MEAVQNSNGQPIALEVERKGETVHTTDDAQASHRRIPAKASTRSALHAQRRDWHTSAAIVQRGRRSQAIRVRHHCANRCDVVWKAPQRACLDQTTPGPSGNLSQARQSRAQEGPLNVISLMGMIGINLGILNLLPIPILDGGNILLLAIEGIMRRDLSVSFKERFVQVGMVFLLLVFAIVMYNDVLRLNHDAHREIISPGLRRSCQRSAAPDCNHVPPRPPGFHGRATQYSRRQPGRLQEAIRERGIRLTRQRRVILEVMDNAEQHLDAGAILERAQKIDPRVTSRHRLPHARPA